MVNLQLNTIGKIECDHGDMKVVLEKRFIPALIGLDGFSHIQILWWFSEHDNPQDRETLTERKPYKHSPDILGTFATRSPRRPNPIALDCVQITYVDHDQGIIGLAYIEAFAGSPVLDIKPYTPSLDRVECPTVPDWCSHWPKCYEDSRDFDWASEITS